MLVVKKFYGDFCQPCKALNPLFTELKSTYSGQVSFQDINIEEDDNSVQKYGVRSVPTVVIEKNGTEVQRFVGLYSKLAYINAINENL